MNNNRNDIASEMYRASERMMMTMVTCAFPSHLGTLHSRVCRARNSDYDFIFFIPGGNALLSTHVRLTADWLSQTIGAVAVSGAVATAAAACCRHVYVYKERGMWSTLTADAANQSTHQI